MTTACVAGARPALWILFQSRNRRTAWRSYSNLRLLEAGAARGFAVELLHPEQIEIAGSRATALRCMGRLSTPPKAALCRSGTRFGAAGRRLLARLEARGAVAEPSAQGLARARDRLRVIRVARRLGLRAARAVDLRDADGIERLWAESAGRCLIAPRFGRGGFAADSLEQLRGSALAGPPRRILMETASAVAARRRVLVVDGRARAAIDADEHAFAGAASSPWARSAPLAEGAAAERLAEGLRAPTIAVDFALEEEGAAVLGVATAPNLEPFDALCAIDAAQIIVGSLESRLQPR